MMVSDTERRGSNANEFELSANIAWRKIGGEGFLITRDGSLTHRLNPTATRILELVIEGKALAEIAATLGAEFDAAPNEIARDVDELIATMLARGVFVKRGDAPCH
jgi:hypothetical protein